VPSCPSGTACKTLKAGNDDVQVCVPKFPRVCDPCNSDADCQGGSAGTTALCLDYGDGKGNTPGKFCGGACDAANACPVGYTCAQVKNATGALVNQCKRTDNVCLCSPRATKLGLGTTCSKSNANGNCGGKRFCDAKGLSPCGATDPGNEICNGLDDNCDGKTGECTATDICKAGQCQGQNNACGDFKISTFKTLGAAQYKLPAIVDMGSGRFRLAWGNTDSTIGLRSYRGDWSREFTEQTFNAAHNDLNGLQAISTGPNGANTIVWSAYMSNTGSCYAYYYNSCTTSNGCVAAAYADCSCCSCNRSRHNYKTQHAWMPYDGLDVATSGAVNLTTASASCGFGSVAPAGVSKSDSAGYADGRRFVVWQIGSTTYRKIYKADGSVAKDLGTEASAKNFSVAVHSDGTSIFVWDDGAEIWAQMYYNDGSTNGIKFQVNTKVTGAQSTPEVAFQPSGRYVVAWNTDQGGGDVQVQVFKPDPGSFLGPETTVNTTVTGAQQDPKIAVYQDGSFGVVFEDASGKDTGAYGILGQWFTSSGAKNGAERIVNATAAGDQRFVAAQGLSSDEGVVAWLHVPDSHVYARKFDKNGNVLHGSKEFVVNSTKAGEQSNPAMGTAANGAFAIAWDSEGVDGDGSGIAFQRYAANGALVGTETVANTFKTGSQITPAVGMDSAGNFVVAWDSIGQDGAKGTVVGRIFQ